MALKIRLQRHGRKKKPFYHIVAADSRAPRDGKFIAKLGTYNPLTIPATIDLDIDAAYEWLTKGAQPTDTARAILKFKGVYYKKHLQRGVDKGAFEQEKADELLQEWLDKKEANIEKRIEKRQSDVEARRKRIFGEAPKREEKPAEAAAPEAEEATAEAPAEEAANDAPADDNAEA